MLQQIKTAGKFFGLGRRQKKKIQEACDNCPTAPLIRVYSNGMKVRYVPVRVSGQLLVCDAYVSTKELPQEVLESNTSISRYEFVADGMRKLFDKYHEALMGHECLRWESDGKKVSHAELHGEVVEVGPVKTPSQTRFDGDAAGMGRTS